MKKWVLENKSKRFILSETEEEQWLFCAGLLMHEGYIFPEDRKKGRTEPYVPDYDFELYAWVNAKGGVRPYENNRLQVDRIVTDDQGRVLGLRFYGIDKNGFQDTKNGKPRVVPFPPNNVEFEVVRALLKRVLDSGKGPWVYTTRYGNGLGKDGQKFAWKACLGIFNERRKKEGLKPLHFTPYDLRHTAARNMAKSGMHPKMASKILGHKTSLFEDLYGDPEIQDVMDEMEKFGSYKK
jgi:integrase